MRILIVEKDRLISSTLKKQLQRSGFNDIDIAKGIQDALSRTDDIDFFIISGRQIDGLGINLIEKLEEKGIPDNHLLLMTAGFTQIDRNIFTNKPTNVIDKPFNLCEIKDRITAMYSNGKS